MRLDIIKPRVFNGKYTLSLGDSHWTFQIRTQSERSRYRPGERLISLLSGPNNQGDWRAFGTVDEDGIHPFNKFIPEARILWALLIGEVLPGCEDYRLHSSQTCYVCNRELTVPESIITGIGPVCAERMVRKLKKSDPLAAKRVELARAQMLLAHATS